MATQQSRSAARLMMEPAVILLLGWMLVPLTMTLWFSFRNYLPLRGGDQGFAGFDNYIRFVSSSSFWPSVQTTLIIVGAVLVITVVLGVILALLLDQPMWGQVIVRILVIAPFFGMPTVSALVYIATESNPNYLGPASEGDIAKQIHAAHGPSGSNLEYALRLADGLRAIGAADDHVFAVAALLERGQPR